MTKNNIFEGANIGDKFLTRGNKIAILIYKGVNIYCIHPESGYSYPHNILRHEIDGRGCSFYPEMNIVSRYNSSLNGEDLEELSRNLANERYGELHPNDEDWWRWVAFKEGVKIGYKQANE